MGRCLLITKLFQIIFSSLFFVNLAFADPLRPDQKPFNKKNEINDSKKEPTEPTKWPRANRYDLGIHFSNSRIDGFQMANNTKGTLVSETNMMFSIQYYNWIKKDYDFSVGLNLETIQMRTETNQIPIDGSQVMAIGLNVTGRYQWLDNLYIKGLIGQQDKLFYSPNAGLTGYEIQKPMIPFAGLGFSILLTELKKIKIGIEPLFYYYGTSKAGSHAVDGGQGYEIKVFSMWPRGTNQILADFFYHSRIQNTDIIRTQEQKIGFGVGYQF